MEQPVAAPERNLEAAKKLTLVIYILYGASLLVPFVWLAAVILNYVKKDEVAGTWLESHFRWQIRTFWIGFAVAIVGMLTIVVFIGWLVLFANAAWLIYRTVMGILRLNEGRPMYE